MATEHNKAFVAAIESACNAMLLERAPQDVTVAEICAFADRYYEQLNGLLTALIKGRDLDLLLRLEAAFTRFDGIRLPKALIRGIAKLKGEQNMTQDDQVPALRLESSLPATERPRKIPDVSEPKYDGMDDIEISGQFARTLRRLPRVMQIRVLNAVREQNGLEE